MSQCKVSVVIPNYNYGAYITETLESVFGQTFQDFEVIVVDDGSTDTSRDVLEAVVSRFKGRLQVIFQKNAGPSIARNAGIRQAQGAYIAFLDADDIWMLFSLERSVAYLENNRSIGLVYANTEFFNSKTGEVLGYDHGPGGKVPYEGQCTDELFIYGNCITMMTTLIRKEVFDNVGLFDPGLRVGEDLELWIRIAAKYPIGYINEVLCRVRRHGNNLSFNMREGGKSLICGTRKVLLNVPGLSERVGAEIIKEKYFTGSLMLGIDAVLHGKQRVGRRWLKKAMALNHNIWRNNLWLYYLISFLPFTKAINNARQWWHKIRSC